MRLTIHHGLKTDLGVTADAARTLRPVGTVNHKKPDIPVPVELWAAGAIATPFSDLVALIGPGDRQIAAGRGS